MRASHLIHPGLITIADWPDPEPVERGEFLVRMLMASLCGSDSHFVLESAGEKERSKPGFPGHEGIGVVVDSRSDAFPVGQVVVTIPEGAFGGCFAQYQVLDEQHALRLPEGVDTSDRQVLRQYLMVQQMGTVLWAMDRFWDDGIDTEGVAVVLGAGPAGFFFTQEILRRGFTRVAVLERNPERLDLVSRLGARTAVDATELKQVVDGLSGGRGASFVVEAVGKADVRELGVQVAGMDARYGWFGVPERMADNYLFPVYQAQTKCLRILPVVGAQSNDPGLRSFRRAMDLIHEDPEGTVGLISGRSYGLEELPRAFQVQTNPMPGDGLKAYIDIA